MKVTYVSDRDKAAELIKAAEMHEEQ